MRMHLQLAAAFLLTTAATAHAQIVNPSEMVSSPPRNPAREQARLTPAYDWLWQYATPAPTGRKQALVEDARFRELLRDNLKAPQAMWGLGTPLSDVARTFLAGEGAVSSTDNRHLTVTGCVVEHCAQRGMLYVDLGERDPLIVFLALRWNEQTRTTDEPRAPFTLWMFPARPLDAHALPQRLKDLAADFAGSGKCDGPTVTSVLVVEPGGVPFVLGPLEAGLRTPFCNTITPHF